MSAPPPLLVVERASVAFAPGPGARVGAVRALDEVSLWVSEGEAVGVIGESGAGKSTLARAAVGLEPLVAGEVRLGGERLASAQGGALRALRRRVQLILQDPYGSLDPRFSVEEAIGEGLAIHGLGRGAQRRAEVVGWMERVGLPAALGERLPHELSGGQRQRVSIARALAVRPQVLVADEPTSALDVTVQNQLLNLLLEFRESLGLGLLFLSHDLRAVRHVADRVVVLLRGKVVEHAPAPSLFASPRHPYTQGLLARSGQPGENDAWGEPAAERPLPDGGCAFASRCPKAGARCLRERPQLSGSPMAQVACFETPGEDRHDHSDKERVGP
jgi:oligopeptide transport system ATP-binding protein